MFLFVTPTVAAPHSIEARAKVSDNNDPNGKDILYPGMQYFIIVTLLETDTFLAGLILYLVWKSWKAWNEGGNPPMSKRPGVAAPLPRPPEVQEVQCKGGKVDLQGRLCKEGLHLLLLHQLQEEEQCHHHGRIHEKLAAGRAG